MDVLCKQASQSCVSVSVNLMSRSTRLLQDKMVDN